MAQQILKGKALRGDADTLSQAGVIVAAAAADATKPAELAAAAAGSSAEREGDREANLQPPFFVQKSRLLMVGSLPSEVEEVMKGRAATVAVRNDLNGGGGIPKGYKRMALNHPAGPSEFSRYRWVRRGVVLCCFSYFGRGHRFSCGVDFVMRSVGCSSELDSDGGAELTRAACV